MKSFYLLLALLPLTLATLPRCECPLAKCPGENPAKCKCENENAIRCAKICGKKPVLKHCSKTTPTSASMPTPTPTICGSRGLPPCAAGQTCVPNPKTPDCDPRADCPGICALSDGSFCGGIGGFPCPLAGQTCVDNPNDGCDPKKGGADCSGICVFLDPVLPPPVITRSPKTSSPPKPKVTGAPCGGFLGTACEGAGEVCVDDPSDDCDPEHGGADCIGVCVGPPCGGFAGTECPSKDQECVDDPNDDCDPENGGSDCIGICVGGTGSTPILSLRAAPKFASCGGFVGKKCPRADQKCVDDPRDNCDPKKGGADCPGICVGASCGGFAGKKCKAGETCVDDPRDSCDINKGGADCIGVCI